MQIQCTFNEITHSNKKFYRCTVTRELIPTNKELKFIGQHGDGMTNQHVRYLQFSDCRVAKVPQGLTKIFPNLKVLIISNSKLKKISKNDLCEYKNLTELMCSNNEIEFLPNNLFENNKNLEVINFSGNQLRVIGPKILNGLEKLKHVNFWNYPNYEKISNAKISYLHATLDEIKTDLCLKYKQNIELYADYMYLENPQSTYKLQRLITDDF
ncbi:hypothetical protein ACKWTF_015208 [Chironomus riparius]